MTFRVPSNHQRQGEERESESRVDSQIDPNLRDDLHLRIKLDVKEYRSFLVLASLCPNTYVHHSESNRFVQNNFIVRARYSAQA